MWFIEGIELYAVIVLTLIQFRYSCSCRKNLHSNFTDQAVNGGRHLHTQIPDTNRANTRKSMTTQLSKKSKVTEIKERKMATNNQERQTAEKRKHR